MVEGWIRYDLENDWNGRLKKDTGNRIGGVKSGTGYGNRS